MIFEFLVRSVKEKHTFFTKTGWSLNLFTDSKNHGNKNFNYGIINIFYDHFAKKSLFDVIWKNYGGLRRNRDFEIYQS